MFRLNGAYFYEGGVKLQAVRGITTGTKLSHALLVISDATNWVKATLSDVSHLRTSYASGQELLVKLDEFRLKMEMEMQSGGENVVGWEILNLHLSVYKFETLLKAELSVSDFYFVTPKGCFDTTQLIDSGRSLFPESLILKVPEASPDCIGAGRCMAFDLPTAAAFHLHRLNEIVLRTYFNAVAPGVKHPDSRTIRAYIDAMKNQGLNNKKVQSALASLNSLHRNPVMHPEQSLDNLDEAIALWGSVNACVVHMLKEIPPPPLALLPPPNG